MKCYKYYAATKQHCSKKDCRYWIKSAENSNCSVTASLSGQKTLQDIGEIYNITRMRICQIEKKIIEKIKKRVENTLN